MANAVTIGLVQMRSSRSVSANVDDACGLIQDAASQGATYIQTPEMTTLIERDRGAIVEEVTAASVDAAKQEFAALAADLGVTLHIGSMAVPVSDGRFANRAQLFGPDGALVTTYDKIHMFDVDLAGGESWRESAIYAPGERCVVVEVSSGTAGGTESFKLGLGVCYDLRFADLFRAQAQAGAHLLTVPAAFTRQTGEAHWHTLLRARAIETGSFVAAAAQGGVHEDERETYGHSIVVDPWGCVVAEKADDEPGILVADLDLGAVADAREKIPALKHDRPIVLDEVGVASDVASNAARAVA
ncbi:MAG: carbon-nitrogen hydrolase family protein [Pseudomonadota bacterium]